MPRSRRLCIVLALLLAATQAAAQPPDAPPAHDTTALAKATQNPVGDLVAVPLQFNFNGGGDLGDATLFNLNIQPAIPFRLTANWNAISRTIVPVDSVPGSNGLSYSGFGDIQEQFYVTPAKPGRIIWGVGPMLSLPTATASPIASGTWAAGLGAVVLAMPGEWVIGALVNQFWPMADSGGEPETNLLVMQPFVNFNFGHGWALAFAPLLSANWDASSGNEWTVPLGGGITRTTVLGGRPLSIGAQYYYNVVRPDGAAATQLRFVVSFLYPKR